MDSWLLSGNANLLGNQFLGTTDDNHLIFRTAGFDRTVIFATGELLHHHNMGIGLHTGPPTVPLSVVSNTLNDGNNTAEFVALKIGPNASHIHWGDKGDWVIRSANSNGKVILQDTGGQVGIGVQEPATPLHVRGRIASGVNQEVAGAMTFFPPDGHAFFHIDNGPEGGRPTGRLRISHGVVPGAGGGQEVVSIVQNGNVGIGTEQPAFKLDVNGEVHAQDFLITSDARLKTNVTQLTGVLDSLALIHGISFQWNKSSPLSDATSKKRQIGIMAQELETVYPELVSTAGEHDYLAVDYSKLTVLLLEAIKELRSEATMIIAKLESEVAAQREELDSLKKQIEDK